LDGILATIGWSSNDYMELDRGVKFPCPSEVGLFDFITLPEFRSRGLYTNALRYLLKNIHERGPTCIYIAVDPNNLSSVKGIQRAGFGPFLRFKRRRVFGISFQTKRRLHSTSLADESSAS
jgi:RimJ/RimL family protein N-acetyltransferase